MRCSLHTPGASKCPVSYEQLDLLSQGNDRALCNRKKDRDPIGFIQVGLEDGCGTIDHAPEPLSQALPLPSLVTIRTPPASLPNAWKNLTLSLGTGQTKNWVFLVSPSMPL